MKEIQLGKGMVALVDDEDYDLVMKYKWGAYFDEHTKGYYAKSMTGSTRAKALHHRMHRVILGLVKSLPHVDHINGNGLDNRKENIRIVTQTQNNRNLRKHRDGLEI